jgi:post-segregation antitoxin (ccd killing protein)
MYLGKMKRTTIFLTTDQVKRLAKQAKRKGINVAQLIRIYISAGLQKERV